MRKICWVLLGLSLVPLAACGSHGSSTNPGSGGDNSGSAAAGSAGASSGVGGSGAEAGGGCNDAIIKPDGSIDPAAYKRQANAWDRASMDCRLGPKFAPGADRLSAYERDHQSASAGYLCKTYELGMPGTGCSGSCDYGSTAGQVLYVPDDPEVSGVERVQTYGYENGVICESPQAGAYLGGPRPDPAVDKWSAALGHSVGTPNGFSQTDMYETNGGILIFPNGLVGATGNQTAGGSQPYFQLPPNKVPTAVAVTSYSEFALITVWDTDTVTAQVAVFALRADSPPAFSVPYFALPNEGGFVGLQLLGYVDLPDMKAPSSIAVSGNNGGTPGGHAIGNEFANMKSDPALRQAFARDDSERWVANSGTAVVLSHAENKVTFLDLRPLFQFVRDVYFTTQEKWDAASAQDHWPYSFDDSPQAKPTVVTTIALTQPTVARVGNQVGAFPKGLQTGLNAFVANTAGEIRAFDISAFEAAARPVPPESIKEVALVQASRNIVSMSGRSPFNRSILVVSRQDAAVEWVDLGETALSVSRRLVDARFTDPVVADLSDRGPVVTIGDFSAEKLFSFRYGPTESNGGKPPSNFGCGANGADSSCMSFEFAGEFAVPGAVFYLGTTNVN